MAQRVGNYEIISKLGQGGMGAVFKARQLSMDRIVALKILPPKLARDAQFVQRFLREARSAGMLSHPNLVNAIECGKAGDYYFFSMEFVPGRNLRQVVEAEGPLDEAWTIELLVGVAEALASAHAKGIVHRDVKPENILLDADDQAKLADLGLAKPISGDADLTMGGVAIGTPHYLSPEQARGEATDGRSDIYSLGATAFHLLTGETLFDGPTGSAINVKHVTEVPRRLRELRPEVGAGIDAIVARCLEKDPAARYPTCAELITDLGRAARGEVVENGHQPRRRRHSSGRTPAVRSAPLRRAGRHHTAPASRWLVPVGIGLVVLIGVVLLLISGRHADRHGVPPDVAPSPEPAAVADPSPATSEQPEQGATPPATVGAEPAGDRLARAEEMLAFAETYRQDHPAELETALTYFRRAHAAGVGTVVELQADQRIKELSERLRARQEAAWAELTAPIIAAREAGAYDDALALFKTLAKEDRRVFGKRLALLHRTVEEAATNELAAKMDALRLALEGERWEDAVDLLEQIDNFPFTAGRRQFAGLLGEARERIAEGRAAARDLLGDELHELIMEVGDGDWKAVTERIERLQDDARYAAATASLQRLAALPEAQAARRAAIVAGLTGRVGEDIGIAFRDQIRYLRLIGVEEAGVRVAFGGNSETVVPFDRLADAERQRLASGWRPATPAGGLLLVLEALAAGDAEAAAARLETADAGPLQDLLEDEVRRVELGEAEAAAEAAWEPLARRDPNALSEAAAGELLAALDAFKATHGSTATFERVAGEWQTRRDQAYARTASGRLRAGLIAHWTFDGDSDVQAEDHSGNGYHLTIPQEAHWRTRRPALVPGVQGRAWYGLYSAEVASRDEFAARFDSQQQLTIALWVLTERHWGTLWLIDRVSVTRPFTVAGEGRPEGVVWGLDVNGDASRKGGSVRTLRSVPYREWHHLAVVFDGTRAPAQRLAVYVDGRLDHTAPCGLDTLLSGGRIQVGGSDRRFYGRMDNIRMYLRAVPAEDIEAIYLAERPAAGDARPETDPADGAVAATDSPVPTMAAMRQEAWHWPDGGILRFGRGPHARIEAGDGEEVIRCLVRIKADRLEVSDQSRGHTVFQWTGTAWRDLQQGHELRPVTDP